MQDASLPLDSRGATRNRSFAGRAARFVGKKSRAHCRRASERSYRAHMMAVSQRIPSLVIDRAAVGCPVTTDRAATAARTA